MSKRKPPPTPRDWARIVGTEWRLHLATGETLTEVSALEIADARRLAEALPIYTFGYLIPVDVLTGESVRIDEAFAHGREQPGVSEFNTFHLFRGNRGTEAVVVLQHH